MGDRAPIAAWPRGMALDVAAQYCGVGAGTLSTYGPKPVRLTPGRLVWLKEDLDAWLDRKAGKTTPSGEEINPWLVEDGNDNAGVSTGLSS